jgi:hypothetical protein
MSGSSSAIGQFDTGESPIEGTLTPTSDQQTSLGSSPDVERLFDNVQSVLPAITLPVIKIAAWNCIEEFAIRSTYFRDTVSWNMAIGVRDVDFNPYSADMQVCWVLAQHGLTRWQVAPPARLVDFYEPTAARSGSALLALKPVSFDVDLPQEMWSTWFETILDGTLFRLYGMPAKPWSSPQLSQYHGSRFRMGINRARDIAERLHSNQQSPFRAFPYFARGRRKN